MWNFPFEVTYRGYNISGWPKLTFEFTSRDFLGRDVVCGYGVTHVPTQPGSHTRYVHIFRPIASSFMAEICGQLRGKPVRYLSHKTLLNSNEGREVTRVCSAGVVKVQFNITMKDMQAFGIHPFKA